MVGGSTANWWQSPRWMLLLLLLQVEAMESESLEWMLLLLLMMIPLANLFHWPPASSSALS
jgi:hypothetical protein